MTLAHSIFNHLAKTSEDFQSNPLFTPLVVASAYALDGLLTPREGKPKDREAVRTGAVVRTRRLIRSNYRLIPALFDTTYDGLAKFGNRLIPFLGVVTGVAVRLKVLPKQKDQDKTLLRDRYAAEQKERLFKVFVERVLGAKSPLPLKTYAAFDDLWTVLADETIINETILPAIDKLLIRSPETGLPIITHICTITPLDFSSQVPQKLVPGIISAAKSAKPENRAAAVAFGSALATRLSAEAQGEMIADILAPAVSGKTTGPEHRIALFGICQKTSASTSTSGVIVSALTPLLSKETNELASESLCAALAPHLGFCTAEDIGHPDDKTLTVIKKDMTSVKTALKRSVLLTVADALWLSGSSSTWSPAGFKLAEAIIPGLEAIFKQAATLLPTSPVASLLEPYMAVALAGGPLAKHLSSNAKVGTLQTTISGLMQLKPKPSFLLNEKVWKKVLTEETDPKIAARTKVSRNSLISAPRSLWLSMLTCITPTDVDVESCRSCGRQYCRCQDRCRCSVSYHRQE